jgi:polyribonucleotide nucleotidyltransferase
MRLAVLDGEMVLDPSIDQIAEAEFNLLYTCTADRSLMIEAFGTNGGVSDGVFAAALQKAHAAAVQLIPPQVITCPLPIPCKPTYSEKYPITCSEAGAR